MTIEIPKSGLGSSGALIVLIEQAVELALRHAEAAKQQGLPVEIINGQAMTFACHVAGRIIGLVALADGHPKSFVETALPIAMAQIAETALALSGADRRLAS